MKKAKIKVVFEIEYNHNPEHYPKGSTRDDMLNIDLNTAKEDIVSFIDNTFEIAKWEINGELL